MRSSSPAAKVPGITPTLSNAALPKPKFVLATAAEATSDRLFTASNAPTPTDPDAAGT